MINQNSCDATDNGATGPDWDEDGVNFNPALDFNDASSENLKSPLVSLVPMQLTTFLFTQFLQMMRIGMIKSLTSKWQVVEQ